MASSAFKVALLLAAALSAAALLAAVPSASAECSAEEGPVNCAACERGGDINIVSGLPRFMGSNNLGDYTWMTCAPDENGKQKCEAAEMDAGAISDGTNPASHMAGVFFYTALSILVGVLCLLCGWMILCCKYCCNCSCCGRRYPTIANPKAACCGRMGVSLQNNGTYAYSACSEWCTRFLLLLFCIMIIIWVGLGHFRGNEGMNTAMKAATKSPTPLMELTIDMVDPISTFARRMASGTVVSLIKDVNSTIFDNVDLDLIIDNAACVSTRVRDAIDLTGLKTWINGTKVTIIDGKAAIADLELGLDSVKYQKDNISVAIDHLEVVYDVTTSYVVDNLKPNVTAAETAVQNVETFVHNLKSTVTSSKTRMTTAVDTFPSSGDRTAAADGTDSLQSALDAGQSMAGPGASAAASRAALITKLTNLRTTYVALPSSETTAQVLESVNTQINDNLATTMLDDTVAVLQKLQQSLAEVPDVNGWIIPAIDDVVNRVRNFDFSLIVSSLNEVQRVLDDRPTLATLQSLLQKIKDLRIAVNCAIALVDEILAFADKMVDLPFLDDVRSIKGDLNQTVYDALANIDVVEAQVVDMDASVNDLTISSWLGDISTLNNTIRTKLDEVKPDAIRNALQSLATRVQFTPGIDSDIGSMKTTMTNNKISATTISDLRSFGTAMDTLATNMANVIADLTKLGKGYCTGGSGSGPYTECSSSTDCGGAACLSIGVIRCNTNQDTACGPSSSTGGDATCGSGDRCLIDNDRFEAMRTTLTGTTAPSVPSEFTTLLDAMQFEFDPLQDKMNNASSSMDDFTSESDDYKTKLADVKTQLNDNFDLSAIQPLIKTAKDTLDVVDVDSLDGTLNTFDSQIATVRDGLDTVDDARSSLSGVKRILVTDIHPYLNRLSNNALLTIETNSGVSGLVTEIAAVVDEVIVLVNNSVSFIDVAAEISPDLTNVTKILDILHEPKYRNNGPLYFFTSLMDAAQDTQTVMPADDTNNHRVQKNSLGEDYSDDRMCVTQACIDKEIDFMSSETLSVVSEDMVPVPLSRTQLVSLPFIIPLLIMLLALCAAICVCFGKLSQCCAGCLAGWTCCQLPLMFILIGFFLPFPILMGDVCYGMENAVYNVLEDQVACADLGGTGTLQACTIETSNVTVTLNIFDVYEGIVGSDGCAAKPLVPVFASLRDGIDVVVRDNVNDTIEDMATDMKLKPLLKDVFYRTTGSAETNARLLVTDLEGVLTCESLHGVYAGFKAAVCCDVASSIYWMVASWWLIAWTFCCCGVCGGLLGRKRLGAPWGPEVGNATDGRRRKVQPVAANPEPAMVDGYGGYDQPGAYGNAGYQQQAPNYAQPNYGNYGGGY